MLTVVDFCISVIFRVIFIMLLVYFVVIVFCVVVDVLLG